MSYAAKAPFYDDALPFAETLSQLREAGWIPYKNQNADLAACFPVLVLALNIPTNLSSMCRTLPYMKGHFDDVHFLNCLAHLGYIGRPATIRLCDLDERLFPCLFIPHQRHKANVNGSTASQIILRKKMDADGQEVLSVFDGLCEEIIDIPAQNTCAGTAYIFTREDDVEDIISKELRKAAGFSWFRAVLERFKGLFWQVFSLSVITGMVSLATPFFLMLVYDRVINAHSPQTLYPLIVGAILALVTEWGLRVFRSRSLAWFGARLDNIVSNKIFEHLLLMPPIFTERAAVASQIARIKAFETLRDFFTGPLFLSLIETPFTLVILAAIALIAGDMALIPVVIAILYTALILWMRPKIKTAIKISSSALSHRQQITVESFDKMPSLRSSGLSLGWMQEYRRLSGKTSLARFQANQLNSIIETIAHGLFIMAGVATIVLGVEKVSNDAMSMGALIACMILVWRVLAPFQAFCTSLPRYEQLHNAVDQINRLINIQTERSDDKKLAPVSTLKGEIKFAKVGLRYTKENDPVFAGLSFHAQPGDLIAITGGNGSGKSTILKLVNNLYRPQAGSIHIDGIDIRQLDPIELRQHIGYVAQAPHFFQGTIAENLRFSEPLASDAQLENALRQVDVWDDICRLAHGLHTKIGAQQVSLPSSLFYRLNLARAYLKQTPIMLFDELPYSLLNSTAGEAFQQTLENWKGKRTIFMVTHREDYIRMSDLAILLRSSGSPLASSPDKIISAIHESHRNI